MVDRLEDYQRVCHEEYSSAAAFAGLFVSSSYGLYYNLQHHNSYSSIFFCFLATVVCAPLALNSFRQGRNLTQKISELEKKLHNPEDQ